MVSTGQQGDGQQCRIIDGGKGGVMESARCVARNLVSLCDQRGGPCFEPQKVHSGSQSRAVQSGIGWQGLHYPNTPAPVDKPHNRAKRGTQNVGKKVVRTMDWRFSRAWSRYDQVGEWEETKVDQDCPKCGMWCPALREHQMHQCGEVRRRILQWQNQVADHVHIEGDKKYRIAYNWGGGGGG